jgi:hypothetical protein
VKVFEKWLRSPVLWLLAVSFTVSFVTLVIYLAGQIFSDETLFLLLIILRYSTLVVFVCSFYELFRRLYNIRSRFSAIYVLKIIGFFILIILCVGIFYLEVFFIVISGGNG